MPSTSLILGQIFLQQGHLWIHLRGLLKDFKSPSPPEASYSDFQAPTNINEVLGHWDEDLSLLTTDTQFLFQQAGRIEKILGKCEA